MATHSIPASAPAAASTTTTAPQIVKQVCGVDVAKDELVVTLGRLVLERSSLELMLVARHSFDNNAKGFLALLKWINKVLAPATTATTKHKSKKAGEADMANKTANASGTTIPSATSTQGGAPPLHFVMEATGVYHECLAYWLSDNKHPLSIVLPNKISSYQKTLQVKTITDQTSADAICRFGLERTLELWRPASPAYRRLRQLTRERRQLTEMKTMVLNQLHAERHEAYPNASSIKRLEAHIKLLKGQLEQIMGDIHKVLQGSEEAQAAVKLMTTIPGIGVLTAAIIAAETDGFALIENKRQLTSYAGLDVRQKQSGTSVNGKPSISKRGNRHLRAAMHLPALSAIRSTERYRAHFARLVGRHGIKMKAAVAVQRKLLELCYTVCKTQTPYQKDYVQKLVEATAAPTKAREPHEVAP